MSSFTMPTPSWYGFRRPVRNPHIFANHPFVLDNTPTIAMLILFHIMFIMMMWSFIQAMTTDPGQVPVFWGFHLGDSENKRRRYCLMCNIFKPERCHHCSSCNRCVLNMDHHCPWINNCIGFWNRKYFLLLLIYVFIVTYFVLVTMTLEYIRVISWSIDAYVTGSKEQDSLKFSSGVIVQIAFLLNALTCILITLFLRFHYRLATTNKTTIENLEAKGKPYKSIYDIGFSRNMEQIFGMNRWLWPFPIFCGNGKPIGDGIYWPTNRPVDRRTTPEPDTKTTRSTENDATRMDVDQEKELQKKETEQTITEETTQQARKKVSEAVRKTICL